MKIKKINELFDNDDLKDRLEVPHLKGELDIDSDNWKEILSKNLDDKFISDILYKYPVLRIFHKNSQKIDETIMISFFASTKEDIKGEYHCQISLALHEGSYYVNTIFRLLEDLDPKDFIINEYKFDDLDMIYEVIEAFLKTCDRLGVINKKDLEINKLSLN